MIPPSNKPIDVTKSAQLARLFGVNPSCYVTHLAVMHKIPNDGLEYVEGFMRDPNNGNALMHSWIESPTHIIDVWNAHRLAFVALAEGAVPLPTYHPIARYTMPAILALIESAVANGKGSVSLPFAPLDKMAAQL